MLEGFSGYTFTSDSDFELAYAHLQNDISLHMVDSLEQAYGGRVSPGLSLYAGKLAIGPNIWSSFRNVAPLAGAKHHSMYRYTFACEPGACSIKELSNESH